MLSNIWGPYAWYLLHILSYSYEDKFRPNYETIVKCYIHLIPCSICHKHFKAMVSDYPPIFDNKENCIKWIVDAHNRVNKRLNKRIIDYNKAYSIYHINNELVINHNKIVKLLNFFYLGLKEYPSEMRHDQMRIMLDNLIVCFPCDMCRDELINIRNKTPITRHNIKEWVAQISAVLERHMANNKTLQGGGKSKTVSQPETQKEERNDLDNTNNLIVDETKQIHDDMIGYGEAIGENDLQIKTIKNLDSDDILVKNEVMGSLIKQQNIHLQNMGDFIRVITKQNRYNPGIKKVFNVKPQTRYNLIIRGKKSSDSFDVYLSINGDKTIINNFLARSLQTTKTYFTNDDNKTLSIYVLFRNAQTNDNFDIYKIALDEVQ